MHRGCLRISKIQLKLLFLRFYELIFKPLLWKL
jgi:hypothetical protein